MANGTTMGTGLTKEQAQMLGMPWYGTDLQYESGNLNMQSDIISSIMNNPNYAKLLEQAQKGMTPQTQGDLSSLRRQRNDVLGGSQFDSGQSDVYKGLVEGKGIGEAGNVINKQIMEKFRGTRDANRADLASRGFGSGGGDYGLATENINKAQDEAYANALMNWYLQGVQTGTSGLSTMENADINRNTLAGNLSMFTANINENARQFGLNYGANITQAQQQDMLGLLGNSTDYRKFSTSQPSGLEQGLAGAMQFVPMAMSGGAIPPLPAASTQTSGDLSNSKYIFA